MSKIRDFMQAVCQHLYQHNGDTGFECVHNYLRADEMTMVMIYPKGMEIVGSKRDGEISYPGVSGHLLDIMALFEKVDAVYWQDSRKNEMVKFDKMIDGNVLYIEGTVPGLSLPVALNLCSCCPFEGVDTSKLGKLHVNGNVGEYFPPEGKDDDG